MKLGILGGSFNPVHHGHLAMAEAVRRAHGLDRVLLLPAARPPHKRDDLAPAEDRLAMVRLAVEGREGLEASGLELERPGPSYTVDTLEEMRQRLPGAELFFIIGEDSVPELPGWRDVPGILRRARVVAVNRPGPAARFRAEDFPGVPAAAIARLEADRVTMEPSSCQSRQIRERLRRGAPVASDVPAPVLRYILEKGLYGACQEAP